MKFKGFNISKDEFEEKFKVELTDLEWKLVCSKAESKWNDNSDELRAIATKIIRLSMNDIGYKIKLDGLEMVFEKNKDELD